jgi:hypothetical protein
VHDGAIEHGHGALWLREDDLPRKLAAISVEVCLAVDLHADDVRRDHAVRAGRPRAGVADERLNLRLDHVRAEPDQRPSPAELPGLAMRIGQPPLGELPDRPLAGLHDLWPARQARTVDVAQPADVIHHLRPVEAFVPNLRDDRVVQFFSGRRRPLRRRKSGKGGSQTKAGDKA